MKLSREEFYTVISIGLGLATFAMPEVRRMFGLKDEAPPTQAQSGEPQSEELRARPAFPPISPHDPPILVEPDPPEEPPAATPWTESSKPALRPAKAARTTPFVNSLGMKFVPVAEGRDGRRLLFCIWETRRKDYERFAGTHAGTDQTWRNVTHQGKPVSPLPGHPVVSVSWISAVAFCKWLTEGERSAGWIGEEDEYRLPSEAEWSQAVVDVSMTGQTDPQTAAMRAANLYPWGSTYPPPPSAGNYADFNVTPHGVTRPPGLSGHRDGYATTAPVGTYAPNRLGLCDLGGNVNEMCQDRRSGQTTPASSATIHIARGGSWDHFLQADLQTSARHLISSEGRRYDTGFRCVLTVVGK